ncbi:tRNA(His) guanylyltransferase 2-like isoform X3 [Olea europaea var. sylvestris]|uniref:tRNA(His) guanylyltransferase 2-like isoform X3 n=1 Tax=Olea europaea var. sylvestris TaxID=158386 RepID=UPI000C1D6FBA|nr:tRNA(His) guanylyltransferase 2-like isoform X3 [Olea europaea var. sylvestris]
MPCVCPISLWRFSAFHIDMANSKYEYVKSFEVEDEIMLPNIIVVNIDGRDFSRFSEMHEFMKPNDKRALELMNDCAKMVSEQFPDIIFSYGFSNEYSFVFKKETNFYQRRASKIFSLIISYFSSVYVTKWKEFFPQTEMRFPPSFQSQVISCASMEVLQAYLAWRQRECHLSNQYNTCLWELIRNGKSGKEAEEILKGTHKQDKNELLYEGFNINYKEQEAIFRQGTCILKTEVQHIVKYNKDGSPVQRLRMKAIKVHSKNIASRSFWNDYLCLCRELGQFAEDVNKIKPDYVKSFLHGSKMMPSTWIVIRIDGCHFHRFSDVHEFEKPNDAQALNLMNSCAVGVLEEFRDIVFSYGVSDEYSNFQFCFEERVSAVSKALQKELKHVPYFDGRAVCYPTSEILLDYLAWRQVDCHINNQYNTCFWMLVKSGKSKSEAQNYLKGTQSQEKNELLTQLSGIIDYYNTLPLMFRRGSSVFWHMHDDEKMANRGNEPVRKCCKVVVEHCNIIEKSFWEAHPDILGEKLSCWKPLRCTFPSDSHHLTRRVTCCDCEVSKFARYDNLSPLEQPSTNCL